MLVNRQRQRQLHRQCLLNFFQSKEIEWDLLQQNFNLKKKQYSKWNSMANKSTSAKNGLTQFSVYSISLFVCLFVSIYSIFLGKWSIWRWWRRWRHQKRIIAWPIKITVGFDWWAWFLFSFLFFFIRLSCLLLFFSSGHFIIIIIIL